MKKNYLIYISSFILLIIMGCDLLNNEDPDSEPGVQDPEGNLVILNYSDERIVLFDGETKMKVISNSSEGFLVNIPNPNNAIKDLRIYKYTDIEDNIETPDLSLVYKRWGIALSADTDIEHRATWRIRSSASTDEQNTGTLEFAYLGGTDYSVDVYVDNKDTGAKLVTIRPGDSGVLAGLEYDNYVLFYRYHYDDPYDDELVVDEVWVETEKVGNDIVPIYLIFNAATPRKYIQVAHKRDPNDDIESPYGSITIKNESTEPVKIFLGTDLIETKMWTELWVDNLSTIQYNVVREYFLIAGTYDFEAINLVTAEAVDNATYTIEAEGEVYWVIPNDAPSAVDDSYSVAEGGTLPVDVATGVLSNDTDADEDDLTAVLDSNVMKGTLTLNPNGSFTYVHDGSETTSDSFTYHASDGTDDSNIATVTIAVTSQNDAPSAVDDSYSVAEGGTLTVDVATGVLSNDTDADEDDLTAVLDSDVSKGTLTLNSDGSFTYVHDGSETTSDSFTYHASDGTVDSNIATVSITVSQ